MPTAPPLLSGLVDDAGLFPPEELPMAAALGRFREQLPHNPVLSGRFLCPAARLPECIGLLEAGERLPLGLICSLEPAGLDGALAAVAAEPRLGLQSVEGVLPDDRSGLAAYAPGIPLYVEVLPGDEAALAWLAGCGLRAKVRCGGLRADLFPTPEALAGFLHRCAVLGVPFKATAGLHHAVAHHDAATGFDHHGFLNLAVAADRAAAGSPVEVLADILRCREPGPLLRAAAGAATRSLFVCYGSCSTTEPLEDLVALGLITEGAS
jgi:hypothetical protein